MNATTIDGVVTLDLRVIPTEGGPVLHMLRPDSPLFMSFGELYFSEVEPGAVKAWKRHTRQTQHFAVPVGRMKVVIHDSRPGSPTCGVTEEFLLGRPDNYRLLRIPPLVWYGFTAVGETPALICNCADIPHDPTESERAPKDTAEIPYHW
ncbi:dTDP-4-dehydrorhamnose 3,5-epimerase [Nitratidesulfovibrio liaohensis]|uniref:dTDP-4-dehydrorhamnose 3,5-epimerase n=1 Tax=Nitratidesulfovibrio liaohensis TaxID=2604158 RepID=A0ABY9R085_9BACT|nr:dTDP-4-dehydrorhamnose 3,5-epimerase [Nitratidesulfovibrio liaohensis]WMW64169.1 dTDP-4-dehydrorhamnose 3,5-epimerase family protein [Nitratidesulfovibrio liaohensis]